MFNWYQETGRGIIMDSMENKDSINRPAWTSTSKTGNFEAFKHKHTIQGLRRDFYVKSKGFQSINDQHLLFAKRR